jgi:hypothetical protein
LPIASLRSLQIVAARAAQPSFEGSRLTGQSAKAEAGQNPRVIPALMRDRSPANER